MDYWRRYIYQATYCKNFKELPSKTFNIKSRLYMCVCGKAILKNNFTRKTHMYMCNLFITNDRAQNSHKYMESVNTSENKRKSKEQLRDVNNIFNPRCKSFVRQGKWGCFFCDKNKYVRVFHTICKSWHDLDCNVTVYISLNWDIDIPKK